MDSLDQTIADIRPVPSSMVSIRPPSPPTSDSPTTTPWTSTLEKQKPDHGSRNTGPLRLPSATGVNLSIIDTNTFVNPREDKLIGDLGDVFRIGVVDVADIGVASRAFSCCKPIGVRGVPVVMQKQIAKKISAMPSSINDPNATGVWKDSGVFHSVSAFSDDIQGALLKRTMLVEELAALDKHVERLRNSLKRETKMSPFPVNYESNISKIRSGIRPLREYGFLTLYVYISE